MFQEYRIRKLIHPLPSKMFQFLEISTKLYFSLFWTTKICNKILNFIFVYSGFVWLIIGLGGLSILILFISCICCCCYRNTNKSNKKSKKPKRNAYDDYDGLPTDELTSEGEEEEELNIHGYSGDHSRSGSRKTTDYHQQTTPYTQRQLKQHPQNILRNKQKLQQGGSEQPLTYYVPAPQHKAIDRVANYSESGAESSFSDVDHQSRSVSAYGDSISRFSGDSSSRSSFARKPGDLAIQASLIYSRESKYVAGKVVMIDGIRSQLITSSSTSVSNKNVVELKCHVVILPLKKYALKTNWYPIKKERVKMDEYFKFKFKQLPVESKTSLRLRLYGRKSSMGRSHCLGECYVHMREIVTSRGGLTLWRQINKGAPEIVDIE